MADLEYLWFAWGDVYLVCPPSIDCFKWRAIAKFGDRKILLASNSDDLLSKIRTHYALHQSGGSSHKCE